MRILHRHVWLPDGQRQGTLSPSLAETPPGWGETWDETFWAVPKWERSLRTWPSHARENMGTVVCSQTEPYEPYQLSFHTLCWIIIWRFWFPNQSGPMIFEWHTNHVSSSGWHQDHNSTVSHLSHNLENHPWIDHLTTKVMKWLKAFHGSEQTEKVLIWACFPFYLVKQQDPRCPIHRLMGGINHQSIWP